MNDRTGSLNPAGVRTTKDMKRFLDFNWVPKSPWLDRIMASSPLIVCDIGANGGLEERWKRLKRYCFFILFEPRDDDVHKPGQAVFKTALWSSKRVLPFYSTAFPQASSLFLPNAAIVNRHNNAANMEIISTQEFAVDAMDDVIGNAYRPDFIKTDTEGADLEILKGAERLITDRCLGLQVEVQFEQMRIDSPLFGECDVFIQKHGYVLWNLYLMRFVSASNRIGATTNHQVTVADAVYFLSLEEFQKRLAREHPDDKETMTAKFLLVLLTYGAHDYAATILDSQKAALSEEAYRSMQTLVRRAMPSIWLSAALFSGLGIVLLPLWLLYRITGINVWNCDFRFRKQVKNLSRLFFIWSSRGAKGEIAE